MQNTSSTPAHLRGVFSIFFSFFFFLISLKHKKTTFLALAIIYNTELDYARLTNNYCKGSISEQWEELRGIPLYIESFDYHLSVERASERTFVTVFLT